MAITPDPPRASLLIPRPRMTGRHVQAYAVARPIHEWLAREASSGVAVRGHVLASFERSCYVEFEERLIAVLARSLGKGAFAITLAEDIGMDSLSAGTEVLLSRHTLHFRDLAVDLAAAGRAWDPRLPELVGDATPQMIALHAFVRSMAPEQGLSRITHNGPQNPGNPLLTMALGALAVLRAGISRGDPSSIQRGAGALAGMGPGLTPSGDDVLAGVMVAARLWPQIAEPLTPDTVCGLIVEAASPRTGKVSRAYLEAAGRGHASEAWHHLVSALSRDSEAVVDAARLIMRIGETSGADTSAGFLYGWTKGRSPRPTRPGVR